MARTITEIKNEIIAAKNARLELNELESDSKVSIFNGWAYVVASAIHAFEVIQDVFKSDIEEILDTKINGTPQFYVNQAYAYQDGDSLTVSDDGTDITYATVDTSKQIITRASYEEQTVSGSNLDKLLLIKVAQGTTGALLPLSGEQLIRFNSYLNKIKFAGTNIQGISRYGDVLIPKITVYHDGLMSESTIRSRVEDALNSFMKNLSFDSALYVSKLFDAISDVSNVTDVYIDSTATPEQGVFLRQYDDDGNIQGEIEVGRFSYLSAGYLKESSKSGKEESIPNFSESIIIKAENE